jgi:hypothetical protein
MRGPGRVEAYLLISFLVCGGRLAADRAADAGAGGGVSLFFFECAIHDGGGIRTRTHPRIMT